MEEDGPQQPASETTRARVVDNDAIIRLSRAGLGEDLILQTIRLQPGHYSTTTDDLITLKNAGVSEKIISAMQAYGTGLQFRQSSPASTGIPAKLPRGPTGVDEIGVYYQDGSAEWVPLTLERVQLKSGGWVKSTFTHNIVKQDLNGHLDNQRSPLVLRTGTRILIYAPEGTQPQEYDLLRFREHTGSREFRVKTGGVFHNETGSARDEIDFVPQKFGQRLYVFTLPQDLRRGEYGVLPPGSSNMRGVSDTGKIFTFSIRQ